MVNVFLLNVVLTMGIVLKSMLRVGDGSCRNNLNVDCNVAKKLNINKCGVLIMTHAMMQ